MSEQDTSVLGYFRAKDPRFNEVPDDELTMYVGARHPQFLKDEDFNKQYESVAAAHVATRVAPRLMQRAQSAATIGLEASQIPAEEPDKPKTPSFMDNMRDLSLAIDAANESPGVNETPPLSPEAMEGAFNLGEPLKAAVPDDLAPEPVGQAVGKVFGTMGRAVGQLAKVYFWEFAREPGLQARELGASEETLKKAKAWDGGDPLMKAESPFNTLMENTSPVLQIGPKALVGLVEYTPHMLAASALTAIGIPAPMAMGMVFGATEERGYTAKDVTVAASLPVFGRMGGAIMGKFGQIVGVKSEVAQQMIKVIGHGFGSVSPLVADQANEISKLPVEQRPQATVDAVAGNLGMLSMSMLSMLGIKPNVKRTMPQVSAPSRTAAVSQNMLAMDRLTPQQKARWNALPELVRQRAAFLGVSARTFDQFVAKAEGEMAPFLGQPKAAPPRPAPPVAVMPQQQEKQPEAPLTGAVAPAVAPPIGISYGPGVEGPLRHADTGPGLVDQRGRTVVESVDAATGAKQWVLQPADARGFLDINQLTPGQQARWDALVESERQRAETWETPARKWVLEGGSVPAGVISQPAAAAAEANRTLAAVSAPLTGKAMERQLSTPVAPASVPERAPAKAPKPVSEEILPDYDPQNVGMRQRLNDKKNQGKSHDQAVAEIAAENAEVERQIMGLPVGTRIRHKDGALYENVGTKDKPDWVQVNEQTGDIIASSVIGSINLRGGKIERLGTAELPKPAKPVVAPVAPSPEPVAAPAATTKEGEINANQEQIAMALPGGKPTGPTAQVAEGKPAPVQRPAGTGVTPEVKAQPQPVAPEPAPAPAVPPVQQAIELGGRLYMGKSFKEAAEAATKAGEDVPSDTTPLHRIISRGKVMTEQEYAKQKPPQQEAFRKLTQSWVRDTAASRGVKTSHEVIFTPEELADPRIIENIKADTTLMFDQVKNLLKYGAFEDPRTKTKSKQPRPVTPATGASQPELPVGKVTAIPAYTPISSFLRDRARGMGVSSGTQRIFTEEEIADGDIRAKIQSDPTLLPEQKDSLLRFGSMRPPKSKTARTRHVAEQFKMPLEESSADLGGGVELEDVSAVAKELGVDTSKIKTVTEPVETDDPFSTKKLATVDNEGNILIHSDNYYQSLAGLPREAKRRILRGVLSEEMIHSYAIAEDPATGERVVSNEDAARIGAGLTRPERWMMTRSYTRGVKDAPPMKDHLVGHEIHPASHPEIERS